MKERLLEFLRAENKSSAQLAEEISVQPSGISHILSGRNNPSLDFVLKMLEKYQFLSTDWLLFGRGSMYKDIRMQSLFNDVNDSGLRIETTSAENEPGERQIDREPAESELSGIKPSEAYTGRKSAIKRIVIFYDEGSFEDYAPKQ
jgi:transcriptional regulator with XRE-family HTH domain